MAKYLANGIIEHEGKVYRPGDAIELTEEQAAPLKQKVLPFELADPEKPVSELTVKELRPLAKKAGIEKAGTLNRGELIDELEAVKSDEQSSD